MIHQLRRIGGREEGKKFRETPAPLNYVAGLGRGAIGFTTRSDIGPARIVADMPEPGQAPEGYVPGAGRGAPSAAQVPDGDKKDYSESNYDELTGYGHSLFNSSDPYDADDQEADQIWEKIDDRMDTKRKARREAMIESDLERYRRERPKIQDQFSDLKKKLGEVSDEQWANLPEIGDRTRKQKRTRPDTYTPLPDSLVLDAKGGTVTSIDASRDQRFGFQTPAGTVTDLNQIGAARKTVLNLKLHQVSDSVSGQTVVDPKGYLTDLNSIAVTTDAEIGDIKKARLLLKSVITTNPSHAPGWIATARLEEVAGKISMARKVIKRGTRACPENADVWLEAVRLQTPENAKIVLADAVSHIPHSYKLWLQAAKLETNISAKRLVLRKALEFNPTSVKLWKAAVELENPDDARIMLARAVECVPHSVQIWLALAKLETYENARKVLNKARETIPTDSRIWITAAKLEEANNNEAGVTNIIKRAVKSLSAHQVVIDREHWIKEAETAEASGFPRTCEAIIRETIDIGVEFEDRKSVWMEDAESCVAHKSIQCARAIYSHALSIFPGKKSVWLRMAFFERNYGTKESLDKLLQQAVKYCPQAEILWLMGAKEKWVAGDVDAAREILMLAFKANPDSEQIWLAAVKLESENNEPDRARELLARARDRAGEKRVWMKSAKLERELGNYDEAAKLLEEALKKFPKFPKLWMMRGQLLGYHKGTTMEYARRVFQRGLQNCPTSIALWLCAAELEEKVSDAKARSLLEKARLRNPKTPELWLAAIEVEQRAKNKKVAENLMAKALQDCPNSGVLWAKAISMETRPKQKSKSVDALKQCDNDPYVLVAVAGVFWADRKVDKARNWFDRAVKLNPDLGDSWAAFYKFELQHGTPESIARVVAACAKADPHHGYHWCRVAKHPSNASLDTAAILPLVADAVESP
eukprot:CAMPEP_0174258100 /NCGR_PEP_ID=MMETSP0439-20130205/7161_1 /TAXON_ID=0 /ORGANISM="Stereomyxa ramosa, Strain Chinc5" /LENGTH=930 /DNA_ID=CAMNT_0015341477 /DNA_START=56 /DNA_END=2848 /DNA_ORIENTATION=-